ncbi:MAG TPA: hypothetical protein VJT49_26080 [Amycolatopsis sp.]|uniref:hypothetical protein n=1 Tax=Amycolatopsis sp. TaxID=37632 RepID=UPI002B47813D|nr:hypothetical protein [Amycolatopsis sp.]HKS48517.1 hypothetical protein [Amycolatopsis sp.]
MTCADKPAARNLFWNDWETTSTPRSATEALPIRRRTPTNSHRPSTPTAPRLLLLDEATSQLDAVDEAALRDVIQAVSARITIIAIAHRLSTVLSASHIVVMHDGTLRSIGEHHTLMRDDKLCQTRIKPASQLTGPSGSITCNDAEPEGAHRWLTRRDSSQLTEGIANMHKLLKGAVASLAAASLACGVFALPASATGAVAGPGPVDWSATHGTATAKGTRWVEPAGLFGNLVIKGELTNTGSECYSVWVRFNHDLVPGAPKKIVTQCGPGTTTLEIRQYYGPTITGALQICRGQTNTTDCGRAENLTSWPIEQNREQSRT